MNFEAVFESLLFLAGEDGIEVEKLTKTYQLSDEDALSYMIKLQKLYKNDENRGLEIVEVDQTFFMKTKGELAPQIDLFLEKYMGKGLSNSELNTLAIVAFRQPIMRVQVDELRGVNSAQILHNLEAKKMIRSTKSNAPGRPKVYRTTSYFLQYFDLKNLRELPTLQTQQKDEKQKELF
ncbi:SMC-Scp complex subunit ScpB [Xylocopilactobacillus apicola]|uniref:Segregation and condensation protein B n=1 Tax=Xylocopilactobacillus apicola TaxID=2932184 RepID=A0AAU9DFF8_9LACO|nr:SMC-Scp complex subunit ScpB [Xylocopilactobacillus apicola]BDR58665.1 segregation and condensation protein B [Xylocopilactobacillus apicola]